jgi:diguanylate cyclase (GGDEF)-like protein
VSWLYGLNSSQPVLVIDLDHFKRINDEHGHPVGDRCLIAVATTLQTGLNRAVDLAARYGGDEFVVLLTDTPALAAAEIAERLRIAVQSIELEHGGQRVPISCSIGVATLSPRAIPNKPTALVALADKALYRAKGQVATELPSQRFPRLRHPQRSAPT